MRRYRNGRVAAALAGVYACLVATLGVVSMVILLTVHDPILVSAVALMVVTFPLGPLIWWGWGFLLPTPWTRCGSSWRSPWRGCCRRT
ncbi:hypothetical protein ACFQYP_25045 [Nonomuraea antimicrobica]